MEQQYEAVADRVARATIRSPVQGTVLHVEINTIGAVVTPGQTLMEIVPDVDKLVIEARVSPMDIDRVGSGKQPKYDSPFSKTRIWCRVL